MLGAPLHILEVVLLDNDAFFLEDAIRVVLALGVNVEDFVVEALADIYNDGVIIFCVSLYYRVQKQRESIRYSVKRLTYIAYGLFRIFPLSRVQLAVLVPVEQFRNVHVAIAHNPIPVQIVARIRLPLLLAPPLQLRQ